MLMALMLQAAVPEAAAFGHPWLTIYRRPALTGRSDEVAFVRAWEEKGAAIQRFERIRFVRERWRDDHVVRTVYDTDSRRCPAAASLVAAIGTLPLPRAVSPGIPLVPEPDGVDYRVTVTVGYDGQNPFPDAMTLRSNMGTPLEAWVDKSLFALERCAPPL